MSEQLSNSSLAFEKDFAARNEVFGAYRLALSEADTPRPENITILRNAITAVCRDGQLSENGRYTSRILPTLGNLSGRLIVFACPPDTALGIGNDHTAQFGIRGTVESADRKRQTRESLMIDAFGQPIIQAVKTTYRRPESPLVAVKPATNGEVTAAFDMIDSALRQEDFQIFQLLRSIEPVR